METIEELWQRLEAWMNRQAPLLWQQLAPGASEEAIKHMEGILNMTLPEEFWASYRRHNGGYKVDTMKILPIESIIDTWQMLMELLEDDDWASTPPYYFTDKYLKDERVIRSACSLDQYKRYGGTSVGFPSGRITLETSYVLTWHQPQVEQ